MTKLQKVVYEILQSSSVAMQRKELFAAVKATAPELCDDTIIACRYCKQKHPLWQHQTAWALQHLKNKQLAHATKRGFWEATPPVKEPPPVPPPEREESVHKSLKMKIGQIGEILGRWAKEEYHAPPYVYDVVWKEVEGLPRPSHVFEVQDKGNVDMALSKLQHARDNWNPRLCLVITGEKDRKKVDFLLKPFLEGTFHRIGKETTVLTTEEIEEIHKALTTYRDAIRQFLEV